MDWTIEGKKQLKSIVCKICDLEIAYGLPKKDPVKICKSLQLWLAKDLTAEQVAPIYERQLEQVRADRVQGFRRGKVRFRT